MKRAEAPLPLKPPPEPPKRRTLAPAWVALAAAWLGLLTLLLAMVLPLLPGSTNAPAELTHARPYSPADRLLPVVIYLCPLTLFLGIVVLRQMVTERRPLPAPLVSQRVQALAGIVLALLGAGVVYLFTALRGPGGHL